MYLSKQNSFQFIVFNKCIFQAIINFQVYLAHWKGHKVAYNILLTPAYKDDFHHGLAMLIGLQPHLEVTQLLGYCHQPNMFITEHHQLGTADNLVELLNTPIYEAYNTIEFRFGLCIKYAKVIQFLHDSPLGTRVMCDSNNLKKTLSQFLVTSSFDIIANDLDALPNVDHKKGQMIKCGHRELFGDFVAPEQVWPFPDRDFTDQDMPAYDEKTDIWKIPNICEHFVGNIPNADSLLFHLFKIHRQCKSIDPSERPTAAQVVQKYVKVQKELDFR